MKIMTLTLQPALPLRDIILQALLMSSVLESFCSQVGQLMMIFSEVVMIHRDPELAKLVQLVDAIRPADDRRPLSGGFQWFDTESYESVRLTPTTKESVLENIVFK